MSAVAPGVANPAMVGRDDALHALERSLADVGEGVPTTVLVCGDAGIGKTTLIEHFLARHPEVVALRASGDMDERSIPLGVVDQLLRQTGEPQQRVDVLAGLDHVAAGAALLDALGCLQQRGSIALVVDDAHWADLGSLRAVLFAVRRLVADTVMVILGTREDGTHLLPEGLLREIESDRGVQIALGPLDLAQVMEVAHQRGVALPSIALSRLYEASEGVPGHVCALLDECEATGDYAMLQTPTSYARLVRGRLERISPATRRLVEAAAVLGRRSRLDLLARLCGDEIRAAALDEACVQDLVRIVDRSVEFVHPLMRAAVHEGLSPATRAELHTAAAALVDDEDARLRHRVQAALTADPELAQDLDDAARKASAIGDHHGAAELYEQAAELSGSRDKAERRLIDSVSALCLTGDLATARGLRQRVEGFEMTSAREFVLGRLDLVNLDLDAADAHLEAAWSRCPEDDATVRMRIANALALSAHFRIEPQREIKWARQALLATSITAPGSVPTSIRLASGLAMAGQLHEALALLDRSVAATAAHPPYPAEPLTCRGWLRFVDDDLPGARSDLLKVTSPGTRGGAPRAIARALGRLARVEFTAGRWDDALVHAEQGLAACVDTTDVGHITGNRLPAVLVLAARGEWLDADLHLRSMEVEATYAPIHQIVAALAHAYVATARADMPTVLEVLAPIAATDRFDEPGQWPWQDLYADALVAVGRLEDAERFLADHDAMARRRDHRSSIARLTRSRARLESARGAEDAADASFAAAVEAFGVLRMPYEQALTELAYGRFLRRRRQRRVATTVLAAARDRFAALRAAPSLAQAERELDACGLTPKRPAGQNSDLTPQELTVVRLVVAGMTNREIAAELIVSTKTVEVHLTRIYSKLEIKSRNDLRAMARGGDLAFLQDAALPT
jgi:DNA-binding CsgD family transcriptional regulator/tetratricopeptide (TPR) repeat protein